MNSEMLSAVLVLVAIFIIITVVNVMFKQLKQSYQTETALLSQGSDSEQVQGIFIRNEKVITYKGNGVISYEVPDGGKVGTGGVIANVYSSENQIEIEQKISSLQNDLYLLERISNPGTTQTAQPSNIAELFTQNYKDYLYYREQHVLSSMPAAREEMLILLSTYQLITGKDSSYADQMRAIRSEITSLKQSQEEPLDVITADSAAYFVSYADGYESALTLSDINALTVQQLRSIQDTSTEQKDSSVIGKLIDNYQWVLAAVVDNSEKKYKQGDSLTLKFASTSETVTGEITSVNAEAGDAQTILGITCEEMTYNLVQHRTENVELIRDDYQGIRVPRSALHFRSITEEVTDEETGKITQVTTRYRGVYVLDGEQPEFRKLDVIYEGSDYVISAQRTEKSYLALYDSIITKGIDADGE
ncbi:MAG: hypothetical protein IJ644_02235 [Oscillospiraceae bacterium]|nr:hypothetical protein [Oscillospiraceae bacterium]